MPRITTARTDDVSESVWITDKQGQIYYQMSRAGFVELSERASARCNFGRRCRNHKPTIDDFLLTKCRFQGSDNGTKSK